MTSQLRQAFAWTVCAALAVGGSSAFAATINYGDFGPDFPPGVTEYQDVRESSGTDTPPLYNAPSLSGNTLDFDPGPFVASATDGDSDSDITDGQLNFDIEVIKGLNDEVAGGLESLIISESGDFSLMGAGTALTSVSAGVSADVRILEVDGSPITPVSTFASASIVRDLVTDGPVVLAPWSNSLLVEFGPVLAENDIPFEFGVTKAEVVINDQLIAISEPNSVSFIAKKDFAIDPGDINPNPDFEIPEPASAALVMACLACVSQLRRRVA